MAQLVNFSGIRYATSTAEAFYGTGSFDTVSYEGAPSSGAVGDYDVGVRWISRTLCSTQDGLGATSTILAASKRSSGVSTPTFCTVMLIKTPSTAGSPDFIYGRNGSDNLLGAGGFDYLFGGNGNDLSFGQQQTDALYGDDGDDQMWGGSNYINDYYPGTNYADVLYGGTGNDQLNGDVPLSAGSRTEYNRLLDFMPGF